MAKLPLIIRLRPERVATEALRASNCPLLIPSVAAVPGDTKRSLWVLRVTSVLKFPGRAAMAAEPCSVNGVVMFI
jgi:hypothetical protein